MPRIRTVKPEFWEDETVGALTRNARLLFIATFNMADDEGLLRWTPDYVKAQAFMYDDDLQVADCATLMGELTDCGLIYPYRGGKTQQRLAWIVNFRKHQKINRPQPSKLPPPSLQQPEVILVMARRDGYVCHLCGGPTLERQAPYAGNPYDADSGPDLRTIQPSPDHVTPRAAGGSDYPSNIKTAHVGCNKGRAHRAISDQFNAPASVTHALEHAPAMSHALTSDEPFSEYSGGRRAQTVVNDSLNDSVNDAPQVDVGREGKGKGKEGRTTPSSADADGPTFEDFWKLYPRKVEKIGAKKAWPRAVKAAGSSTAILQGLQRQLPTLGASEPQFIPHPTTWLNNGRWDDAVDGVSEDGTLTPEAVDQILGRETFQLPRTPDGIEEGTREWQQWARGERDRWREDRARRAAEIQNRRAS